MANGPNMFQILLVFKSFIIVSTHHRHYITSGTGFKHDSPNPYLDSLTECSYLLNPDSDSL